MKKVTTSLTFSLLLFSYCQVLQAQANQFGDFAFETSPKIKNKDLHGNKEMEMVMVINKANRPMHRSMVALVCY
jgi:hypothetical protein